MKTNYTNERNVQMLIMLMKEHGIKKVIASPGAMNIAFVASIQQDDFFEIYSAADERSAAYIACGLAAESGEPVAISCTGATSSRNYLPGLTEAYYRKLPVLAITAAQHTGRIGQLMPQALDRSNTINDAVKMSIQLDSVHDRNDGWANVVLINKALLELKRHGGGPVHINMVTTYSHDFTVKEADLMPVRKIDRISIGEKFPVLQQKRLAVFVGAHLRWSDDMTSYVDAFCEKYNGVVFCDHTSNYKGKYGVFPSLITCQEQMKTELNKPDIMIHIGEISGAYWKVSPKEVWRVNPDGEIRDTFRRLRFVFEMEEEYFFKHYSEIEIEPVKEMSYYAEWKALYQDLCEKIPELPFSNLWVAKNTFSSLPSGATLHLGILNSLRSWNFFESSKDVFGYCNTGGFGIDGNISTLLGASLSYPNKLFFGIVGDLSFFYDMNSLGNRHVGRNVRIMVINNGCGTEFKNYSHMAAQFGEDANEYIAAAGHYGKKSPNLLRHYAEDLGFEYLSASSKEEYLTVVERFTTSQLTDRPILLEVFTDSELESKALELMKTLV